MIAKFLMICLCLILPFFSTCSKADIEQYIQGNYTYSILDDGTAELLRYSGSSQRLSLPARLNGHAVTSLGPNLFSYKNGITELTIPASIKNIDGSAFSACSDLKYIDVASGNSVFRISNKALVNKTDHTLVKYPPALPFSQYDIPPDVTRIGDYAFYMCSNLSQINLSSRILSIGDYAFAGCTSLESIIIPDSITDIGIFAFDTCHRITSISLPSSVSNIGHRAFNNCLSLSNIYVDSSNPTFASIDGVLFHKVNKELVKFPDSYRQRQYIVPEGILSIGSGAFSYSNYLESVTLPNTVLVINSSAFSSCASLSSIEIPPNTLEICDFAFSHCNSLTSISIPGSVRKIGNRVLSSSRSIEAIFVEKDSYAEQWCQENGYSYSYIDTLDWLRN